MQNLKCLFLLALLSVIVGIHAKPAESDPPPLDCPEKEEYLKCKLTRCFTKCDHLIHMPGCPMLAPGCVVPACVCKKGYLRNDQGVCIRTRQCPQWAQADQGWWNRYSADYF
ncbi:trypsin inhibitor like cysteine rich domain-containing protein [Phthorimaea operculella]|nr:trypsin inhibitor like cysteine rich domain-containing protein [Phthorimaea operculella]